LCAGLASLERWVATGGDASAYSYLLKGVHAFPDAERLAAELRETGFREVAFERLSLGIVAIHTARKPGSGRSARRFSLLIRWSFPGHSAIQRAGNALLGAP
jgi:ubiE/COQ5 methyltransferase family